MSEAPSPERKGPPHGGDRSGIRRYKAPVRLQWRDLERARANRLPLDSYGALSLLQRQDVNFTVVPGGIILV